MKRLLAAVLFLLPAACASRDPRQAVMDRVLALGTDDDAFQDLIRGGGSALDLLKDDPQLTAYQPYWAARAELLSRAGLLGDAAEAYGMAIGLESDPQLRNFLLAKLSKVNSRRQ